MKKNNTSINSHNLQIESYWINLDEACWTRLETPKTLGKMRSFISREGESDRLRISYFINKKDNSLIAKAWFGPGAQGPPGHAHGGSIAAVLDEVMGAAVWHAGQTAVSSSLRVEFKRMLRLNTETIVQAWVESIKGKEILAKSRLLDPKRKRIFAFGEGSFSTLKSSNFSNLTDVVNRI